MPRLNGIVRGQVAVPWPSLPRQPHTLRSWSSSREPPLSFLSSDHHVDSMPRLTTKVFVFFGPLELLASLGKVSVSVWGQGECTSILSTYLFSLSDPRR